MMNMEGEGDHESMQTTQRKKKDKNTRRFTDEQISSLESMFKLETKLEPRKKLQLARELGLQPRQVAIWFQNRRARWKSKQIEQDYSLLKSSYDNLSSRFDSLNKENQSLLSQLQKLRGKFKNQDSSTIVEGNFSTDESESGEKTRELKEDLNICSDDDNIEFKNKQYLDANGDEDGGEFTKLSEQADVSLVPIQKLRGKFKNQDSSMIVEGNFSTDESESGEKTRELKEDLNICSDDDNIEFKNKQYLDANGDEDGGEFTKLSEQADVSLVPTDERWCNLESGGMLNWWDYST